MTARITLLPSARRLIDSLRDIGYDLPTAVADIVDNSIAARATRVDLTFRFDGLSSWIRVSDNGVGMSGRVLEEAMRYGTQREYGLGDLGRFGLGLKTASLSQCRCLTVASRQSPQRKRIEIRRWDLDDVARTNRWEVLRIPADTAEDSLTRPLDRGRGTVVLWQGLDRVMDYSLPDGAAAKKGFDLLTAEVCQHLAMVFHRFLAGEARGRHMRLTLNGTTVRPWDPFARAEGGTRQLEPQALTVEAHGRQSLVIMRPFVLPTQQCFSSATAHTAAAGPGMWNRQQGLYFYRNDRLIQAGGWNRLRTTDEHTKLARIAVDIPDGLEELFGLNVAKMRVVIPRVLRNQMMAVASGVAAAASTNYRNGVHTTHAAPSANGASDQAPESRASNRIVDTSAPRDLDLLRAVSTIARDEFRKEPDILRRFLARVDRVTVEQVASMRPAPHERSTTHSPLRTRRPKATEEVAAGSSA